MKRFVGALLVAGAVGVAVAVVATRDKWAPALKAGIQETLIWALDDPSDDEDEDESEEKHLWLGHAVKGPQGFGQVEEETN